MSPGNWLNEPKPFPTNSVSCFFLGGDTLYNICAKPENNCNVKDTMVVGRVGKVLRLVRVMRILRVFKVNVTKLNFILSFSF